jgi:hypothetical protein
MVHHFQQHADFGLQGASVREFSRKHKRREVGRKLAQSSNAIAKRMGTMLEHRRKIRQWKNSNLPSWLTRDVYVNQIQPALAKIPKIRIRRALGVSEPYSSFIKEGKRIPHTRHWYVLAKIAGLCGN